MKIVFLLLLIIGLLLLVPGVREDVSAFFQRIWHSSFSTMQDKTTISGEARKEAIIRKTQFSNEPEINVNPLRTVSHELKAKRTYENQ